jgi:hypothetical protein
MGNNLHMSTGDGEQGRIMRLEEHQLFLERQIEELSGEVLRLGKTVQVLQRMLESERARIARLADAIEKDGEKGSEDSSDRLI